MAQFIKAAQLQWKWLGKSISGVVERVFLEFVTKTIKGKKITRHGSKEKFPQIFK